MLSFLIRIKGDDKEFLSILPLVYGILEKNELNRVHIIVDDDFIVNDHWFHNRLKIYHIPKKKRDSLFGAHHFAANLHEVFNIDYYLDFVSDFNSAFLGLAFRARKKIGLQGGPKSYLYSFSLEKFEGLFLDQQKISSLSVLEDFHQSDFKFLKPKELKREFENVLFDLTSLDETLINRYRNIFNNFEDLKSFGWVPRHLEEGFQNPFGKEDKIELFEMPEEKFTEGLEKFDLFITDSYLKAQVALLNGVRSFLIMNEEEELVTWALMESCVGCLKFDELDLVLYGFDEQRPLRIEGELEDYIINFNTLRLEPS